MARTFTFDGIPVNVAPWAHLQPRTLSIIQEVLNHYTFAPFAGRKLIILEFDWLRDKGQLPVVELLPGDEVRYAPDPTSTAKPKNRQPMPFVYISTCTRVCEMSVYLEQVEGRLQLVRSHFGRPFPPAPFQSSSRCWPGYTAGGLTLDPGFRGCREFWLHHAMVSKDIIAFNEMSVDKPSWLK